MTYQCNEHGWSNPNFSCPACNRLTTRSDAGTMGENPPLKVEYKNTNELSVLYESLRIATEALELCAEFIKANKGALRNGGG